ncbi:MAG: hypothetical protein L3J68_03510 [Thermoplasmata archaeon]|nr:hypothetical protein [Thermoplasmata archaeon]
MTAGDLEVNVLEFRQRSFQFQRIVTFDGREVAHFSRTETETESQFRPKLIHLHLLVPVEWVVFDEPNDVLLLARDGATIPVRLSDQVVEVGAERTEFDEQGIPFRRVGGPSASYVYAPGEIADRWLTADGFAAVGLV